MEEFLRKLIPGWDGISEGSFEPIVRYYPAMDSLIYLKEDCSYRADRVDTILTLLWHPQDQKLVGIKLKGFGCMFRQMKRFLPDSDFLMLVDVLARFLVEGGAESLMASHEGVRKERLRQKYHTAITFAGNENVRIPSLELERAAA